MIRHVLLDADGVLQRFPSEAVAALRERVGRDFDGFLVELNEVERPCLAGERPFRPVLADLLRRRGLAVPVDELYPLWHRVHPEPRSVELVQALRASGLGVHLATNQHLERAAYMRRELGYDDLLDRCYYSCDVRAAKPAAAFFEHVLGDLGAASEEVLFVDDHERNVIAARAVGIQAELWSIEDGYDDLRALLARHGVAA